MSDVLGQLRLAWIKMSLHNTFANFTWLLFGIDEISLATNLAVRSSEQLVAIVHALITKVYRYKEMYLSESVEIVVYIHTSLPVIVMFLIIQHHWCSLGSNITEAGGLGYAALPKPPTFYVRKTHLLRFKTSNYGLGLCLNHITIQMKRLIFLVDFFYQGNYLCCSNGSYATEHSLQYVSNLVSPESRRFWHS